MKKKVYIRSAGIISPQDTFGQGAGLDHTVVHEGNRMNALEPDYKLVLDPKSIRRMSRIIRMGTSAALECMSHAGISMPDAIITGTAYGCLEDTIIFLNKMEENKEEMLTPTAFIQSTHNSVGAQIALSLKCQGYNNTFVHRGLSFEQALLDAMLIIDEGDVSHILIGGIDELTDTSHAILSRFGLYRQSAQSDALIEQPDEGTMAGEGAGFFLLSSEPSTSDMAVIEHLSMRFDANDNLNIGQWVNDVLSDLQITMSDIDLLLLGQNGDLKSDSKYKSLLKTIGNSTPTAYFKHLCGEYPTASAFGLWMAASSLKNKRVPFATKDFHSLNESSRILMYNSAINGHHSLMLLSAC
jgi:3-oxoacyl-[acyl-carrier-protein] synthase II